MHQNREYRVILATDIERSAGRGAEALRTIRSVLQTTLRESAERSGIRWDDCLRHDSGDGIQLVMPRDAQKTQLLHPLLGEFSGRLRAHNRLAAPLAQVRVRLVLHAGDVEIASGEASGPPLEVTARMLDALPLKSALEASGDAAPLAVLLSPHFYEETVPHGYPGIDSGSFREVTFAVKKYSGDAWLYVPGGGVTEPPRSASRHARPDEGADGHPEVRYTMTNNAAGRGVINAAQHGSQHVYATGKHRKS